MQPTDNNSNYNEQNTYKNSSTEELLTTEGKTHLKATEDTNTKEITMLNFTRLNVQQKDKPTVLL